MWVGDDAHAMLWLEHAFQDHYPLALVCLSDPALDHLRGSPRFRDLAHRMELPLSGKAEKASKGL